MNTFRKFKASLFVCALLVLSSAAYAQLEVTHLILKGQSATGVGAFLHAGFPVSKGDEVSAEIGFDYFSPDQSHLIFVPLLVGYRHTFNRAGTGFYLEPFAGYTFGATDIAKTDAGGNPLYNPDGTEIYEKFDGADAGLGIGYILPNAHYPLNFGLRYERIFTSSPSPGLLSFRISWSVLTGRRLLQQQ